MVSIHQSQWWVDSCSDIMTKLAVYFSSLIFAVPIRRSQGYRLSVFVKAESYRHLSRWPIIQRQATQWWCLTKKNEFGHTRPAVLRLNPESRYWQRAHYFCQYQLSVLRWNTSTCVLVTGITVCQCQISNFFFFTNLGIGFLKVRSIGTKQLNTASCKYQLYQSLHGCVVIKWFCTTPQFFIDFHPGARSNGVLAPRRTLRPQVLSHCQAALIRSYKSWRDNC